MSIIPVPHKVFLLLSIHYKGTDLTHLKEPSVLEASMKTAEFLNLTKYLKTDTQEISLRNREEKAINSREDQELSCRPQS